MPDGFKLGDHQFLEPGAAAPISRIFQKSRRPIRGAAPPRYLTGCVREVNPAAAIGAAVCLVQGEFCGHGEPTYSVFDVVIDGKDVLEFCLREERRPKGPALVQVLVRPAGPNGNWTVIHHGGWFAYHVPGATLPLSATEVPASEGTPAVGRDGRNTRFRVAIGFEYPADCGSADEVSWVAVAVRDAGGPTGEVVLDEELA